MEDKDSHYCKICGGCGEDGCCSAINCQQHKDGLYCETYLKDMKFAYRMYRDTADMLPDNEEIKGIFDKNYNETYGTP